MKTIKSHFEIHKRFRNGILLLVLLMFLLVVAFAIFSNRTVNNNTAFVELTAFQTQIDSLKKVALNKKKSYTLKPFNPNFITEHKGYILGISPIELDRLYDYRKKGKWVNSVSDFKKVTGISDSLLKAVAPLFKFPEWVENRKRYHISQKPKYPAKSFEQKGDLNTVTSLQLQEEIGVPDFIADRMIRYRDKLEGFIDDLQLKDVVGLYENQRKKILSLYTVKTFKDFEKININKASVKELMEVPYFDFEMALDIKDFIEERNGISDFKDLGEIEGFYLEKIDRIALYLILN